MRGLSITFQRKLSVVFGLWEQKIPQLARVVGNPGKDGQEVIFEDADCAFHHIALVHVWQHELESNAQLHGDDLFVGLADLVAQYLEVDIEGMGFDARHDVVVCHTPVPVLSYLERAHKDGIGVAMVCHHHILVARTTVHWKPANIVSV